MRAVFVRRRTESKLTPAWMGGLNYEDNEVPKLPWNIDKRALSSDFASALQTRVHTGSSDWDFDEGSQTHRVSVRSRPGASGHIRLRSARPAMQTRRSPALQLTPGQGRRPQTAGAPGQRTLLLSNSPAVPDTKMREGDPFRLVTAAGSMSRKHHYDNHRRPGSCSTTRSEKEKRLQAHRFYSLQINVVGVGGSHDEGVPVNADAGFYNACVALAIDGTSDGAGQTHISKPFKFNQIAFVPVPEDWVQFELTGNVHRMLLSVKVLRKTSEAHKAGEAGSQRECYPHRLRLENGQIYTLARMLRVKLFCLPCL